MNRYITLIFAVSAADNVPRVHGKGDQDKEQNDVYVCLREKRGRKPVNPACMQVIMPRDDQAQCTLCLDAMAAEKNFIDGMVNSDCNFCLLPPPSMELKLVICAFDQENTPSEKAHNKGVNLCAHCTRSTTHCMVKHVRYWYGVDTKVANPWKYN